MSEHKFRYLLPPGNNFQFVAKFKTWLVLSVVLLLLSVGALFFNKSYRGSYMNWTIDFKGGTEIILAFQDKATKKYVTVEPGKLRKAVEDTGQEGIDISEFSWQADDDSKVNGMVVRTTQFSAMKETDRQAHAAAFRARFKDKEIVKATWSGDRFNAKSKHPIPHAEAAEFFKGVGLETKPWTPEEVRLYTAADQGTLEYNQWFSIWGVDRQYQQIFEKILPNTEVIVQQSYGVGAKAGDKLRDDAIKSLVYAIFLIMLYLAFRFDVRYAPGAAFATIHDATMVIGVFALTWTEVSLASVAGLLTVVGFSVNDTVVVFDRIRENQAKLKDKKIERIIDISLNEVLVRSLLTSLTVFSTTLIMNVFGTGLVKNFAFAMNVGVIVGAYSSIFLAAPFFLYISKKWYSGAPTGRRRVAAVATTTTASASALKSEAEAAPDPDPEDAGDESEPSESNDKPEK